MSSHDNNHYAQDKINLIHAYSHDSRKCGIFIHFQTTKRQ